ncbi:MAG TPA: hypothetical protein VGQ76_09780 [Thermoanaerobaculia bacterium]|nr:hypothetical protein [Thermoanaerobaculia bacterium]
MLVALALSTIAAAQDVVFTEQIPFVISGKSTLPADTRVIVIVENAKAEAQVKPDGTWSILWTAPFATGTYDMTIDVGDTIESRLLRVQLPGLVARQSGIEVEPRFPDPLPPEPTMQEMTDRWRIVPPPYELDEHSQGRFDPYNQNILKGDRPIRLRDYAPERFRDRLPFMGDDAFLVLTGISDSLVESRTLPTPSGVSADRPGSFRFFGSDGQGFFAQNVIVSADVFEGDTTFQPVRQRLKITLVANLNHLRVEENAIIKPSPRRGTERTDARVSLQELFYERKLRDLGPNYDFVSFRAGIQPFASDFRGFIFSDTNLAFRLFGNWASNRYQYNLAIFDRLEKDTNSGLNIFHELREQRVAIANFYWQDFLRPGYTQQFSLHHVRDDASLHYDRNGVLVRPAPVGDAKPHSVQATYVGMAGLGHFGRINIDHALYYVFGRDSLNPIAGADPQLRRGNAIDVSAGMAAVELSYDKDWLRPRIGFFYATGDRNPRDRTGTGFDAIFDAPAFAGGGFSFFNRLGIRLAGSGVALVERGSLLPSLRSSKDEGQPNYVNPGVQLATIGLDAEVTPRLKAVLTGNYIRLDAVESVEQVLFQDNIHHDIGTDLSVGLRYRPFLSNNVAIVGGAAVLLPGKGFEDIYETKDPLYHAFMNVILQF